MEATRAENREMSTHASGSRAAISASNLFHAFPSGDAAPMLAVNDVSFEIPQGQMHQHHRPKRVRQDHCP